MNVLNGHISIQMVREENVCVYKNIELSSYYLECIVVSPLIAVFQSLSYGK